MQEVNADVDYVALKKSVYTGFSRKTEMLHEVVYDYWIFRNEMSIFNRFVLLI